MEFSIRWNKAKDDLTTICSRERDVDDVVKILPNDSITSAEIAAITAAFTPSVPLHYDTRKNK